LGHLKLKELLSCIVVLFNGIIYLMKTTCQVCGKEIKRAKYFDKIRKAFECGICYMGRNSKIK